MRREEEEKQTRLRVEKTRGKSKNSTERGEKSRDMKSAENSSLLLSVTVCLIRGPNSVITLVNTIQRN